MTEYGFLYETDSATDGGYRVVAGATYEEARLEWVRQVQAEGQTVHLCRVQKVAAL